MVPQPAVLKPKSALIGNAATGSPGQHVTTMAIVLVTLMFAIGASVAIEAQGIAVDDESEVKRAAAWR